MSTLTATERPTAVELDPANYFVELANDFDLLGLPVTEARDNETWYDRTDYYELYLLLDRTMHVGQGDFATTSATYKPLLRTPLGKEIADLGACGIKFEPFTRDREHVCQEAEFRLLLSLEDYYVESEFNLSPLIVTNDGKPCAIIKTEGEKTMYALDTIPEYGLVAGAFASRPVNLIVNSMPKITSPWSVPLDALRPANSLRMGMFQTPAAARANIHAFPQEAPVLTVEHADIVKTAVGLLSAAQPADLETPDYWRNDVK